MQKEVKKEIIKMILLLVIFVGGVLVFTIINRNYEINFLRQVNL